MREANADHTADGVTVLAPSVFWADPDRNPYTATRIGYATEYALLRLGL